MNFPHLNDTAFPDLQTVDVYQYQNNFDYTRWTEDTRIRLVNVIWNSDYKNVVKFDTNAAREYWFDHLRDYYAIELTQAARIVPENFVKLPIPYDVMARYNYLYIDLPIATSADAPIDYENSRGIRRWYFFIQNITYLSPNTTQVYLTLDVWTNYQNEIKINYMMLERGHAPVYASDVDTYLANPIANNRYLLAPDVNFDNAGITRSSKYVPFGNGSKYVCIASTCGPESIANLGSVTTNPDYNPTGTITYSDVSARYGHQLQVNGLTIGDGRDFSSARTPATVGISDNGYIPNNLTVYAIAAEECYGNGTFLNDLRNSCPQFLNTVVACFVVDGACLQFSGTYTIAGHTIRKCEGIRQNLLTQQLQKTDFAYPQELQRFANLYTSPYAELEITDNDGTTFTVNIEETSTLSVKSVVSVAFPYVDYRVYLDGIGGVGSESYSWIDLKGQTDNLQISNSDWFKYCFDWKIPTFALYMDGETAYQLSTFNRNTKMGIQNALVAYHNSMRSANTAMENAIDTAETTLDNVYDSTTTAKTNADASADTAKTNADNTADTNKTNADNSADTTYNCTDRSRQEFVLNSTYKVSCMMETEQNNIDCANQILAYNNAYNDNERVVTYAISWATTQTEISTSIAQTNDSVDGNVGASTISGAVGGLQSGISSGSAAGAVGATLLGALGGFGSSMVSGHFAKANATLAAQCSETTAGLINAKNRAMVILANDLASSVTTEENNTKYDNYATAARFAALERDNTSDTIIANETEILNTTKTNATNTQVTAKTNATNTQITSKANAQRNYTNDRGNALRTKDTIVANSGYTREVAELNAKELLENAARSAMAPILDARNAKPVEIGITSGDSAPDFMRTRGIQIKVKTQSDSAIRQTGDVFARFGYALNQMWNVEESGLCLMKHFTYWKASDIWVDDRESSNNYVHDFFEKMFLDGVTVWSNPDEIGRVNIYAN